MHTYHSATKMKPVDVKPNTCLNSSEEINDANPKFKVGDIFRISKYKSIFAKGYVPNWSEEVFVTKKLVILKAKKLLERFMKQNCGIHTKKSLDLK